MDSSNGFRETGPLSNRPIRLAAIGDLHLRTSIPRQLADDLSAIDGLADLLVITGDLTEGGKIPEVELACELLAAVRMPKVAVLGNHDRRGLHRKAMRIALEASGVTLLEGTSLTMTFEDGRRLGIAGVGGYGGGFWPEEAPDLVSARISKAVGVRARREALRLRQALHGLVDQRNNANVVVLHYSPTVSTLGNEPLIKYWMLGNSLLGKVIDEHRVDLVLHGHAHLGNHSGQTPGGVPVRNVAAHVTGRPMIYDVSLVRDVNEIDRPWTPGLPLVSPVATEHGR